MAKTGAYKPRYAIAYLSKTKVNPYKNSYLRRFFEIRARRRQRVGNFRRNVLVAKTRKWTIARRFIRPFRRRAGQKSSGAGVKAYGRPRKRRYRNSFYIKQQVRFFHGKIKEKSFQDIFKNNRQIIGNNNASFFNVLESRLDRIFFRRRILPTIYASHQYIQHHGLLVNGVIERSPRAVIKTGDVISLSEFTWKPFYWHLFCRVYYRRWGLYILRRRLFTRIKKKLFQFKKKSRLVRFRRKRKLVRWKNASVIVKSPKYFSYFINNEHITNSKQYNRKRIIKTRFYPIREIVGKKINTVRTKVDFSFFGNTIYSRFARVLSTNYIVQNKIMSGKLISRLFSNDKLNTTSFNKLNNSFWLSQRAAKFKIKKVFRKNQRRSQAKKLWLKTWLNSSKSKIKNKGSNGKKVKKIVNVVNKQNRIPIYNISSNIVVPNEIKEFVTSIQKKPSLVFDELEYPFDKEKVEFLINRYLPFIVNKSIYSSSIQSQKQFFQFRYGILVAWFELNEFDLETEGHLFQKLQWLQQYILSVRLRKKYLPFILSKFKSQKDVENANQYKGFSSVSYRSRLRRLRKKWCRKQVRQRKIIRLKAVHRYFPAHIQRDLRTLRAVKVETPRLNKIYYPFRGSLAKVHSFYRSRGF